MNEIENEVDTHIESFIERLEVISEMMAVKRYIKKYNLAHSTRERNYTIHRQYLMWKIRKKTMNAKVSVTYIGKLFNRDHATVLHAIKCIDSMLKINDPFLKEVIATFGDEINGLDYENI